MKNIILVFTTLIMAIGLNGQNYRTVKDSLGKYGFIDKSKKQIIDFQYDYATVLGNNTLLVNNGFTKLKSYTKMPADGKWAILNPKGNVILGWYDSMVSNSYSGRIIFVKDKKWGVVEDNKIVIPFEYSKITEDYGKYCRVVKNGKYGLYTDKGKMLIPCDYKELGSCHEGMVSVSNGQKEGYLNLKNKLVIPYQFESTGSFSEGFAYVTNSSDLYGFIDKNGKLVVDYQYDDAYFMDKRGLAMVYKDMRWGVVDKTGKQRIPCVFTDEYIVIEFFDWVSKKALGGKIDNKFAFYDFNGNLIGSTYDYIDMDAFINAYLDVSVVRNNGKYGLIDKNGVLVSPIQYEDIYGYDSVQNTTIFEYWEGEAFYAIKQNGKYGIFDDFGKQITCIIYDQVKYFPESETIIPYVVKRNNQWYFITKKGTELTPDEEMYQSIEEME